MASLLFVEPSLKKMRTATRHLPLLLVLVLGFFVYSPGIGGPFVLDDLSKILQDPHVAVEAVDAHALAGAASQNRPLPHLSFALNYFFAGKRFDASAFKLTNVAIHLVNTVLVYMLSLLLMRRFLDRAAAGGEAMRRAWLWHLFPYIVALLWSVHPIQLTSVLYVVQRMTSMSAMFSLAGLALFVVGRVRLEKGQAHGLWCMAFGVAGGTVLGSLCKETAVLTPFFAVLIEVFFFQGQTLAQQSRRSLLWFYVFSALLPALISIGIVWSRFDTILGLYEIREFTPQERLLTQPRVLLFYLSLVLFPNLRQFGIFHDDIAISHGWLSPWTTLGSVVFWLLLLGLALRLFQRRPVWVFALLWFLLGHAVESSLLGLEIAYEHRNYMPSFGIFFALGFYPVYLVTTTSRSGTVTLALVGVVVGTLCCLTLMRADSWGDYESLAYVSVHNHPTSYRAHTAAAFSAGAIMGETRRAYTYYERAASLNPGAAMPLIEMAKLVQGFLSQTRRREAKQNMDAPQRSEATIPSKMNSTDLQALTEELDREVRNRLREHPIVPTTALALVNLTVCARAEASPCVDLLPRVQSWHRIAIDNPRIKKEDRIAIEQSLARSFADAGRIDEAAAVLEAVSLRAGDTPMQLEALARDYQRAGDTAMAQAALKALEAQKIRGG
jgi:hypothetical protein